jgi:hypothetical protein
MIQIVLLPRHRTRGFGPARQRKLSPSRWWHFCDMAQSMGIPLREDVLHEWFIMGYSVIQVWDAWCEYKRKVKG